MTKQKEHEITDSDKKAAREHAERIAAEIADAFGRAGTPETWNAAIVAMIGKIEEAILFALGSYTVRDKPSSPVAPLTTRDGK